MNRSTFIPGQRFGTFVTLAREGRYRLCRCDCGRRFRVRVNHLHEKRCVCQGEHAGHVATCDPAFFPEPVV
jgi:hypothetical protein